MITLVLNPEKDLWVLIPFFQQMVFGTIWGMYWEGSP